MNSQENKGLSLAETMVVIAIISIVAVIAIPSFSSNNKYDLDLAVGEISAAIRFARNEALRTGDVYGVEINQTTNQLTIYKADLSAIPVAQEFIAYHPINKDLYDYSLNDDLKLSNINISNTSDPFLYSDSVRRKSLLFTSNGTPVWIDTTSGATHQLQSGVVQVGSNSQSTGINVAPFNGRVSRL